VFFEVEMKIAHIQTILILSSTVVSIVNQYPLVLSLTKIAMEQNFFSWWLKRWRGRKNRRE